MKRFLGILLTVAMLLVPVCTAFAGDEPIESVTAHVSKNLTYNVTKNCDFFGDSEPRDSEILMSNVSVYVYDKPEDWQNWDGGTIAYPCPYAYVFAKVTNGSSEPFCVYGEFAVRDARGQRLTENDLNAYGHLLLPGEYVYIAGKAQFDSQESAETAASFDISINVYYNGSGVLTKKYPCAITTTYEPDLYWGEDLYVYNVAVDYKNTNDFVVGQFVPGYDTCELVYAVFDQNDNIVMIASEAFMDGMWVLPGETVHMRQDLYDWQGLFNALELKAEKTDAYVFWEAPRLWEEDPATFVPSPGNLYKWY